MYQIKNSGLNFALTYKITAGGEGGGESEMFGT